MNTKAMVERIDALAAGAWWLWVVRAPLRDGCLAEARDVCDEILEDEPDAALAAVRQIIADRLHAEALGAGC
jgi:hypothetical protein